ncbi:MAG: C45 family peptidase [Sandaracinaceae bacterium]|nr:C45 family peptidase [Sandaracinaceae bacterium]
MRCIELPEEATPYERGLFHGESFRDEIAAIAMIRSELCKTQGRFKSDEELLRVARLHIPVLRSYDEDLFQELRGIGDGARLPIERVVVLNHYTDLKDIDPKKVMPVEEEEEGIMGESDGCTSIVASTEEGVFLGQTWDMHGSALPFVAMMRIPGRLKQGATQAEWVPEAWVLTITGCLGMAGINSKGVGIAINNLRSLDARVGLVWPALVRRVLEMDTAAKGCQLVCSAPLGSGHHYLVADAREAFGIETSGTRFEVWRKAEFTHPGVAFHHENHCLGRYVCEVSEVSPTSTTIERFGFLENSLATRPISSGLDLWERLGSHEGYPRSVCTHLATHEHPHAMLTCAAILCDLSRKKVYAHQGCIHGVGIPGHSDPTRVRAMASEFTFRGSDR